MSLLGKRRNSFNNGEDEITVSRIRPDNDIVDFSQKSRAQTIETTRSSVSSETDASDYPIHDSCVYDHSISPKYSLKQILTDLGFVTFQSTSQRIFASLLG